MHTDTPPATAPKPRAPRPVAALQTPEEAVAFEMAALRAAVNALRGQHDAMAAELHSANGRLALTEWRLANIDSKLGKLPPVPAHLREFVRLEPSQAGPRQVLDRLALLADCDARRS